MSVRTCFFEPISPNQKNDWTCTICKQKKQGNLLGHIIYPNKYRPTSEKTAHVFHQKCIEKWFERYKSCPLCKGRLKNASAFNSFALNNPEFSSYIKDNGYDPLKVLSELQKRDFKKLPPSLQSWIVLAAVENNKTQIINSILQTNFYPAPQENNTILGFFFYKVLFDASVTFENLEMFKYLLNKEEFNCAPYHQLLYLRDRLRGLENPAFELLLDKRLSSNHSLSGITIAALAITISAVNIAVSYYFSN